MNNTDKILEDISSVKMPDFPFSDLEIKNTLTKIDKSDKFNIFKNKGTIAMGIISSLIISVICTLFWFYQNTSDLAVNNSISDENQTTQATKNENDNQKIQNDENINGSTDADTNKSTIKTNKSGKIDLTFDYTLKDTKKTDIDSIDVLVLSDKELEKINVKRIDCGYLVMAESGFPSYNTQDINNLKELGYPKKGIVRTVHLIKLVQKSRVSIVKYQGWDLKNSPAIFPISVDIYKKTGDNTQHVATQYGNGPVEVPSIYINNDIISAKLQGDIHKSVNNSQQINSIKVYYDKSKNKDLQGAVPVFLKSFKGLELTNIILTYTANDNFMRLLPDRYKKASRNELLTNYIPEPDLTAIQNQFQNELPKLTNLCNPAPKILADKKPEKEISKIAGIEKLELSREEAEKIGIIL